MISSAESTDRPPRELQSFADNFRAIRYVDGPSKHDTGRLIAQGGVVRDVGDGHRSARNKAQSARNKVQQMLTGRQSSDYTYSLIRSDLDDDMHEKPSAIKGSHIGFARKRTVARLGWDDEESVELSNLKKFVGWVDDAWFQRLSGCVIFINAVAIGLESHYKGPWWVTIDLWILVFFCTELFLRLVRHGLGFFTHEEDWTWNWFDFLVVVTGIFDQWIFPAVMNVMSQGYSKQEESELHKGKKDLDGVMRLIRLLRILRLFRLVRVIRQLRELVESVMEALQGMFWVLVFMVGTLYSVAIVCTQMIGHGNILPEDMKDDEEIIEIRSMFTSVQDSMFTLFGTMSSWSLMKFVPLFEEIPLLKPAFVLFYVYSAWALLAVMTGVVSESMIAIRERMLREDQQRDEVRKTMITKTLLELFNEADVDRSGTVSRQEFDAMLKAPELVGKITKNTHLKVQDLQALFDWLDYDGSDSITIDEFMQGFKWVNEPLRAKSLVKLQERVAGDIKKFHDDVVQGVDERVGQVHKLVYTPMRKVDAITKQMQALDVQFGEVRFLLREQTLNVPSPQHYNIAEAQLHEKLDDIFIHWDNMKARRANLRSAR